MPKRILGPGIGHMRTQMKFRATESGIPTTNKAAGRDPSRFCLQKQFNIYLVSLYIQNYKCYFGDISGEEVILNKTGLTAQECWYDLPIIYPYVHLDIFTIMPNHLHGILLLANTYTSPPHSQISELESKWREVKVSDIIRGYMTISANFMSEQMTLSPKMIWQQEFESEHITNDELLDLCRDFICDNPAQWKSDPVNPNFCGHEGVHEIPNCYPRN